MFIQISPNGSGKISFGPECESGEQRVRPFFYRVSHRLRFEMSSKRVKSLGSPEYVKQYDTRRFVAGSTYSWTSPPAEPTVTLELRHWSIVFCRKLKGFTNQICDSWRPVPDGAARAGRGSRGGRACYPLTSSRNFIERHLLKKSIVTERVYCVILQSTP